ncbi:DUF992 domain-containing protein [Bosea sp. (in: a-proteobacteria)]|uniref:DUF992 domain-containing protein n=1 Tax=Bosea sp. (in: a-proteobacteria) TaxID=1871050 RepID=UPI0033402DA7
MSIRHSRSCLSAAAVLACLLAAPAQAQSGPPTGRLSCAIGTGLGAVIKSQRPLDCRFRPRRGPTQHYTGIVRQYGLDLGSIRGTTMGWHVYGPYARAPLGALNGRYAASGAAGAGTARAPLVGGANNKVTLQPRVVQTTRGGFNVAVGVTQFELTLKPPGRRR